MIANNSARRLYPQTKTPLTKLLTQNEMAEFQRVLGGTNNNSKTSKVNPGEYFNAGVPTREIVLNQVSTSRIGIETMDQGKASKLEMTHLSKIGARESPPLSNPLSPLSQAGHH